MIIIIIAAIALITIPILWYNIWQWENLYVGKKILAKPNDGLKFNKLMYIGDSSEYGMLFYDGTDRILFHARGLWHCYKHVEDNVSLFHLRASYQMGPFEWKGIYISWCGLNDLEPKDSPHDAVMIAKRHVDSTPAYKYSSTGEKYRNDDFIPQAQEICNAMLWLRNFREFGWNEWCDYEP